MILVMQPYGMEFLLVLIGIVVAIIFGAFQSNSSHKKYIVANMKSVEERLQLIIGALAAYLSNKEMGDLGGYLHIGKKIFKTV